MKYITKAGVNFLNEFLTKSSPLFPEDHDGSTDDENKRKTTKRIKKARSQKKPYWHGQEGGVEGRPVEKHAKAEGKRLKVKVVTGSTEHPETDPMTPADPKNKRSTTTHRRQKQKHGNALASATFGLFRGRDGERVRINRKGRRYLAKHHGIRVKRGKIHKDDRKKAANVLHPEDSRGRTKRSAISRTQHSILKDRGVGTRVVTRAKEREGYVVGGPQGRGNWKNSTYARSY